MEKDQQMKLKSDKMGTMPVGKLLFNMSLPAMISMLVQALYNVVDSIFVSQYSDIGFTAVNLSFPMVMLVISFGIGIGVGANAQIAKKLGEGDREGANKIARNALFLAGCVYLFFIALTFTCSRLFLSIFVSDDRILDQGTVYLNIYIGLCIFSLVEMTCSRILQSTGNMKVPMTSQLIGAITNTVLDPLFINGLNINGMQIVPEMGVAGAAIATIIGQALAMTFVVTVFIKRKQDVSISLKGFRPDKRVIGEICRVGLPAMVMNAITSVTVSILNGIIAGYAYAVDTLGIYFKLQSFVFMPVFGLTQGALPILGYNFGCNQRARFKHTVRLAMTTAIIIMIVGMVIIQFGSPYIIKIFNTSDEMAPFTVNALQIISWCFIPAACGITVTTIFQSVGNGLYSLLMSLCRQLILLVPIALIMNSIIGVNGVWWAFPLAEVVTVIVFFFIMIHCFRRVFREREEMFGVVK